MLERVAVSLGAVARLRLGGGRHAAARPGDAELVALTLGGVAAGGGSLRAAFGLAVEGAAAPVFVVMGLLLGSQWQVNDRAAGWLQPRTDAGACAPASSAARSPGRGAMKTPDGRTG